MSKCFSELKNKESLFKKTFQNFVSSQTASHLSSLFHLLGLLLPLLLLGWVAVRLCFALLGRAGLWSPSTFGRSFLFAFLVMLLFGLSFLCSWFVSGGCCVWGWFQSRFIAVYAFFCFWQKTFFLFESLLLLRLLVRLRFLNFGLPGKVGKE